MQLCRWVLIHLLVVVSAGDHTADVPLGRVDIPIKEIMREAARPSGMRLASAAKIAYKLRQSAQRARERVAASKEEKYLRCRSWHQSSPPDITAFSCRLGTLSACL